MGRHERFRLGFRLLSDRAPGMAAGIAAPLRILRTGIAAARSFPRLEPYIRPQEAVDIPLRFALPALRACFLAIFRCLLP